MALTATYEKLPLAKFQQEWGPPPQWYDFKGDTIALKAKLAATLKEYTLLEFDHIEIGHLGRKLCVFVTRGDQAAVLYDKTKSFPTAKLLAALVLLGSR